MQAEVFAASIYLGLVGVLTALFMEQHYRGLSRVVLRVLKKTPRPSVDGEFVAEVFLTWYFGAGSILFRKRYATIYAAEKAARFQAQVLDWVLPKHYAVRDCSGRRRMEENEYGISWGVRTLTEDERSAFHALDKRTLPGY